MWSQYVRMRENLAREFPEAARAAEWTRGGIGRRLAFRSEPVVWATISGIGAGLLVSFVAQSIVGVTSEALDALRSPQPFALLPLVTIAGSAAAAGIALTVGGPVALFLYVIYVALGVALGIPGWLTFCERSGGAGFAPLAGPDQCTTTGFLVSLWPRLVGIGLGIALARAIATRGDGVNSMLRIAGAYAVAQLVMSQVWSAAVAQTAGALASGLTFAAGMAAAAAAAGVVAAHLPQGIRNAAIVAAVSLLPWLTSQLPYGLRSLAGAVPNEFVAPLAVGILVQPIVAGFLVLGATVAARSRFVPREPA